MLGSLIIIFLVIILVFFSPRQYERKYLQRSEEWKSLTFRQYADSLGFYIGTIPGGTDISDPVFCNNLNSVTPENSLKMGPLFRDKKIGEYDFTEADRIVNQALEKKLRVRGHTLVWGKQSDMFKNPDLRAWLKTFPESERSGRLKELVDNHIVTVLNHFRGRIHIWDCVNEPTSIGRPGRLDDNVFTKYLGGNYIEDAFRIAHSVDPALKLYLNEQINDYRGKQAEYFLELLRKLKKDGVPVAGVGLQSHILTRADTAITDLQDFMKKITDMGLEVELTEIDMRLRIFDAADDPYEAQGKYYARLIKACMENPACKGVTFWGFSDGWCWIDALPFPKPNEPYLFDSELNPKPAFFEIYSLLRKSYESKGKLTM